MQARALHIRFSSNLGEFSVYAEVSFNGDKYNLDNVINVPSEWLRDLGKLDVDRVRSFVKKRILKIPGWGQRAMLVESDTAYVFELPDISDRGSFSPEHDLLGRLSRSAPVRLEDYLANYPKRASGPSRNSKKKFTPNNGL